MALVNLLTGIASHNIWITWSRQSSKVGPATNHASRIVCEAPGIPSFVTSVGILLQLSTKPHNDVSRIDLIHFDLSHHICIRSTIDLLLRTYSERLLSLASKTINLSSHAWLRLL